MGVDRNSIFVVRNLKFRLNDAIEFLVTVLFWYLTCFFFFLLQQVPAFDLDLEFVDH